MNEQNDPVSSNDHKKMLITSLIFTASNKKVLSVYLIHSLALEMSAIQIFVGDKMAVVAHLVGKDTIGHEPNLQLEQEFKHLPWRAMIIKGIHLLLSLTLRLTM